MEKIKVTKDAYYAKGGRKASVSRVYLQKGKGRIVINGKEAKDYFGPDNKWIEQIYAPLRLLKQEEQFDVICFAKGGGVTGQSEAIRMGVSRCLDAYELKVIGRKVETVDSSDAEASEDEDESAEMPPTWRKQLRAKGYLTRDSRAVLRKRVGFRKARKRPQYSKR